MILKIKTGKGSRGVLNYISAGAGQAAPMFTNMAGQNPRELAREVAALRGLRPNLGKAAAHLILAHDPGQRPLTEAEWGEALEIALKEHGAEGVPYAVQSRLPKTSPESHVRFGAFLFSAHGRRNARGLAVLETLASKMPGSTNAGTIQR